MEAQALEDLLMEVGGEITDEQAEAAIDEWLLESSEAVNQKLDSYAGMILGALDRARSRKEEAGRLASLARLDESVAERLKNRLRWHMEQGDIPAKVQTKYHAITLTNNGGRQAVEIFGTVPPEFQTTVVVTDNDKIRAALERGEVLPFARLESRGRHVRIK